MSRPHDKENQTNGPNIQPALMSRIRINSFNNYLEPGCMQGPVLDVGMPWSDPEQTQPFPTRA